MESPVSTPHETRAPPPPSTVGRGSLSTGSRSEDSGENRAFQTRRMTYRHALSAPGRRVPVRTTGPICAGLDSFTNLPPAEKTQKVAEEVLLLLFKSGYRPTTLRGAVSALKAVRLLGWIPDLGWDRLWRLAKAPVATKGERAYAGPHVLQTMAVACCTPYEWSVFAAAAISFACLTRVGGIASIRRSRLRSGLVSYWGLKRDARGS